MIEHISNLLCKKAINYFGSIIYDVDEEIHPHLFFYKKIETYENSS